MEPLISVVIPSYNYETYIGAAIRSIMAQTYANIELVIIDDCSRDGSFALISSFAEAAGDRFTNIIVRQNEHNMGAHETINAGI